jgi:hypothetical protein
MTPRRRALTTDDIVAILALCAIFVVMLAVLASI